MKPIIIAAKKEGKKSEKEYVKHLAPVPFSFQNTGCLTLKCAIVNGPEG